MSAYTPEWRSLKHGQIEIWAAGDSGRWFIGIGRRKQTRYLNLSIAELQLLYDRLGEILPAPALPGDPDHAATDPESDLAWQWA